MAAEAAEERTEDAQDEFAQQVGHEQEAQDADADADEDVEQARAAFGAQVLFGPWDCAKSLEHHIGFDGHEPADGCKDESADDARDHTM